VLVLVVGGEGRGKEMLVQIARRRFEADASLAFPARVTTRLLAGAAGDLPVSRRTFREMAAAGAFLGHWDAGGHSFGLQREAFRSLELGRTVVVVAGVEGLESLAGAWDDVRAIEIKTGPDAVVPSRRSGGPARLEVRHDGDVAAAVRRFHDIIVGMRLERLSAGGVSTGGATTAAIMRRLVADRPPAAVLRAGRDRG
jgi:ribose 1,5-bisphosphokinase